MFYAKTSECWLVMSYWLYMAWTKFWIIALLISMHHDIGRQQPRRNSYNSVKRKSANSSTNIGDRYPESQMHAAWQVTAIYSVSWYGSSGRNAETIARAIISCRAWLSFFFFFFFWYFFYNPWSSSSFECSTPGWSNRDRAWLVRPNRCRARSLHPSLSSQTKHRNEEYDISLLYHLYQELYCCIATFQTLPATHSLAHNQNVKFMRKSCKIT